ncbi:uncharacterized protein OCT59_024262 [Rhizophagus irregularis]|uniref:uncharacterized protein n=1 Tax=Rhizophagus irregularis TaxID=588596 RepID=UPI001A09D3C5|nr:hypothetical protein OCT59_024262 [Rhizophagus irregularis]GET58652.1 hypothetical protein RIR_jg14559.t1 [Rhizophagus irregularis DAOM 181602=DAOM 197198]
MEKHIIDYLRTSEYRSWGVLSVLQYLSVNIKYTNDNIKENFSDITTTIRCNITGSQYLQVSEQEEEEIPAQDVQPSQDKPELSQELSPLPYTLYENDMHYTIIIYTPSIISKN